MVNMVSMTPILLFFIICKVANGYLHIIKPHHMDIFLDRKHLIDQNTIIASPPSSLLTGCISARVRLLRSTAADDNDVKSGMDTAVLRDTSQYRHQYKARMKPRERREKKGKYWSTEDKHRQVDKVLQAARYGQVNSTVQQNKDASRAAGVSDGKKLYKMASSDDHSESFGPVSIDSNNNMNKKSDRRRKNNKYDNQSDDDIVSITDANHAIITAGRLGRIDDALEIFEALSDRATDTRRNMDVSKGNNNYHEHRPIMNNLGYGPDLMTYNNIIWSTGNAGRFELAKSLYSQLKDEISSKGLRFRPNVYTFGSLIHGCVKAKAYKQALLYLDEMEDQGIAPNQIVFTSAMEACAESGRYKEATSVMERMTRLGMKPDLTMVNAAIKACSLAGAMDDADTLADTLREYGAMDVFTYHTLMMGNTKLGRHYRVLNLYDEAIQSSAQLDGGIYSLAMLSALNCGLYPNVPRIADRARKEGVALTEASYTILIQALAEAGAGQEAVKCLDTMITEGLKPNVISYAAAMTASREKPKVVIELLNRMKQNDIAPNTVVLTSAINSLAREGGEFTDMAFSILIDMENNGPDPNIYTYNTMVRAFAEAGRLDEALELLEKIKSRGFSPDRFTFTTLLLAAGRRATICSGKKMNQQETEDLTEKSSAAVSDIMRQMKSAGIVPDEIAYGAAIDAHRRANNSLKAVECLHDMYTANLEPIATHYNLVLRTLRDEGYIDKMYKMAIAIGKKADAKVNTNTFELTIEALLGEDRWKEALVILKIMETMHFKPTLGVYVALVEKLEKARQFRAVMTLYRAMVKDGYDFYENTVLNEIFKKIVSIKLNTKEGNTKGLNDDSNLSSEVGLTRTIKKKANAKSNTNKLNRKKDKALRKDFKMATSSSTIDMEEEEEEEEEECIENLKDATKGNLPDIPSLGNIDKDGDVADTDVVGVLEELQQTLI